MKEQRRASLEKKEAAVRELEKQEAELVSSRSQVDGSKI